MAASSAADRGVGRQPPTGTAEPGPGPGSTPAPLPRSSRPPGRAQPPRPSPASRDPRRPILCPHFQPGCPPAEQLGCHGNRAPARPGPVAGGGPGPARRRGARPPLPCRHRKRRRCGLSVHPNGIFPSYLPPPSPSILAGRFPPRGGERPLTHPAPAEASAALQSAPAKGLSPHGRHPLAGFPSSPCTATQVLPRWPPAFPHERGPIAVGVYQSIYLSII